MVRPVRGALSQERTARAARRNEQGKGARFRTEESVLTF